MSKLRHLLDVQLMLWNLAGCAVGGAIAALLIATSRMGRRSLGGHLNVQIAAIRTSSGSTERRRYWRRIGRG